MIKAVDGRIRGNSLLTSSLLKWPPTMIATLNYGQDVNSLAMMKSSCYFGGCSGTCGVVLAWPREAAKRNSQERRR